MTGLVETDVYFGLAKSADWRCHSARRCHNDEVGRSGKRFIDETPVYLNLTFAGTPLAEAPPIGITLVKVAEPSMAILKIICCWLVPI